MKIIPIWFHQKSWSHPQSDFSNELVSQIHMFHIICVRTKTAAAASRASGSRPVAGGRDRRRRGRVQAPGSAEGHA